ncbi:adenylate/guanylate cyclase domain-containing protein [Mycoplana sp. MJR14]|uniref:adenylate/guanylate cyclase domain-containing protein n=1 Tax=Mycoplana sp. MJR14 TaxID=3032583 RepID=UPI0023DAD8C2|nr:adenylate/guanylate cyclase domain-containing protein [Mycoplana sp. MJR14]MDF1634455.1 adenylate/guanylate cyclase domain-containing protein [Mycoplana sp. MJR14]
MKCAACGFTVEDGFAFCPKCGAPQQKQCPSCGQVSPPDYAFCPKCGTSLAPAARQAGRSAVRRSGGKPSRRQAVPERPPPRAEEAEADRRIVTALFADLCGYTTLSEKIDPEVLQALQNEIFEELSAAVTAEGGYVDKFVGDALLALFGAPVAHERDPERALRAALDMRTRMARIEDRWRARLGEPLALHIGVNTGPVVAGAVGAGGSKSYSVTGDTVNTAQRLQAMAGFGEILVGAVTRRLTEHAFAFATLGTTTLRGKAGETPVFRLEAVLDAPPTARGLASFGIDTAMIGRDPELAALLRCLEFVRAGATQLVRIVGDAGVGKTRLVETFLDRVRAEQPDITIRQTACSSLGEASYGTLAAALRRAYQIDPAASLDHTRPLLVAGLKDLGLPADEIRRLEPLFLFVLGFGDPDDTLRHLEPDQLRRQIFHAMRILFERRMEQAPMLVVIEDLHWADSVSIDALRFIMDRMVGRRLMLLVTHRPGFETEMLNSARASQTTLRLSPLAIPEAEALLEQALGGDVLPHALRDRIVERAEGNPFFIEEILRTLIETGVLHREAAGWEVEATAAETGTPLGIQAMMLARIDRLPGDARRLAQVAAVIGHSFDVELLKALPCGVGDIAASLQQLGEADIVEELVDIPSHAAPRYAFRQKLLQEVFYDNLLLRRRTELHGAIGTLLERRFGTAPQHMNQLIELGYHFAASSEKEKGVRYLTAAGDLARMANANADALRLYARALSAAEAAGGDAWREPGERYADLCHPTGRSEEARHLYDDLLAEAKAKADVAAEARILRKLGQLAFDTGDRERATACFAEAAHLLEGVDAPIELAHLMQRQGHLAFRAGDYRRAMLFADRALECANHLTSHPGAAEKAEIALAIARAFNTKGVALARLGKTRDAVEMVERSVKIALDANHLNTACRGYTNLGSLYTTIDPARAIDVCQRGYEMARQIGDLGHQARLLTNLAAAYCTFTDRCLSEGLPAVEEALSIDRALGLRDHLPVPLLVLGQIRQCHGAIAAAREHYLEALALVRDSAEAQLLFPCYDGLATLCLETNELSEAERYFELAQQVCAQHGLDPDALMVLPFLD